VRGWLARGGNDQRGPVSVRARDAAARRNRRRSWGTAGPALLALAVVAAACSPGTAVGTVGSTLQMSGVKVTLDKVIEPAPVSRTSIAQPRPGNALVAIVLTFTNPSSSPADLAATYHTSKLTDSNGHLHVPNSRFTPADCQVFGTLGQLAAQQAITGCEVFQLSTVVTPRRFAILGPPKVAWDITPTSIASPSALGPGVTTPVPATVAPTTTVTTKGNTGGSKNTGGTGTTGTTGNTGTTATTGGARTKPATAAGLQVLSTGLPPVTRGIAYSYRLSATGATAPYRWKVTSGALPRGLKLSASGLLHGRSRSDVTPGVFVFTVQVRVGSHHRDQISTTQSLSVQLQ